VQTNLHQFNEVGHHPSPLCFDGRPNLVLFSSNAAKFSPPGGRIEVVTKLLWPSPPGIGAVPPVGPGDPEWIGNSKYEKLNGRARTAEQNGNGDASNYMPELVSMASSGRVPLFGNAKDKDREKQKASSDEKGEDEQFTEKPPVTVPVDQIVIRIEVRDTGTGIKKKDIRDARLFSPYVQVRSFANIAFGS
jgi:signal transduction histidine kinase